MFRNKKNKGGKTFPKIKDKSTNRDRDPPQTKESKAFQHLNDAELDSKLAPYLTERNIPAATVEAMQRSQKEQLLDQCLKLKDTNLDEKNQPPVEIVRRFVSIFMMQESDLSAITNEFRSLRVYVANTDLSWLTEFYEKGGAVPVIKMLSRLSSSLEKYLTKSVPNASRTQEFATAVFESVYILRTLLNNTLGIDSCFDPALELSTTMFDLLYICNLTKDESFTMVVSELVRLLKVLPAVELSNKSLGTVSDFLLRGLDRVASSRDTQRFAFIINCFKWKTLELPTLQLLLAFFNMVDNEFKARVSWRHEFWNAGFADHFEHLNELALKNSELRTLLDPIIQDYEQDIKALTTEDVQRDKTHGFDELYKTLTGKFKKGYHSILVKDIIMRLTMLVEQDSMTDAFDDLCAARVYMSYLLFFSGNSNTSLSTQLGFIDRIQTQTMESDTIRLNTRLQKTVDEKQQAKALQMAYYENLTHLKEENLKLRAHIEDPTQPLPEQFVVNVQSPKKSDNTNSNHSPIRSVSSTQATSKSSTSVANVQSSQSNVKSGPPPAPPMVGLNLKSGNAPKAPPLPPKAPPLPQMPKTGNVPKAPGPPPPPMLNLKSAPLIGAPPLAGLNIKAPSGPKLPSHLKQKQDVMAEIPIRKLAGWEADQIPPKDINKNSLWIFPQDEERQFASETVYNGLLKNFARPVTETKKAKLFTRPPKKTVVYHDVEKLKMWEILSGRKIKEAEKFKNALIEIDLSVLDEELISLIQEKLPDESIFKKLRETPFEKFENAPDGERLLAVLSQVKDLPKRLRAILLVLNFHRDFDTLRSNASSIAEACDQIKNSNGLKNFAALVLVCCNYMMRTQTQRSLCYGYLMSLLPRLIETKDIANKLTLFDHLLIIFDQVTKSQYEGFGLTDFMQVDKARHLELSFVIESITKLSGQVNAVKSYHSSFKQLNDKDRLGIALNVSMPDFLKDIENLLHLKQSMESKASELEEFFSYDPKKYKLENLFGDIYKFSLYYKTSFEKIRSLSNVEVVRPLKASENVEKKRPVFARTDPNHGLLEKLEVELENKKYRTRPTPSRGLSKFSH